MSKLLGQGGYGCVYWPEILCSGKVGTKKYVTKLQKKNWASQNEIDIGKKISTLERKDRFIYATSDCNVKISSINKNVIKDCDVIKKKDKTKYVALKFPYVEHNAFRDFFDETTKPVFYLINSYIRLVKSLEVLADNNIVHHDLKMDNILMTENNFPKVIDFGISIDMDKMNPANYDDYFYTYATDYYPWSFEIHIMCYIIQVRDNDTVFGNLRRDELYEIVDNYMNNSFFELFSEVFVSKYRKALKHFVSQFVNKPSDTVLHELLKTYKTWDMVALSILFMKLLNVVYKGDIPNTKFLGDLVEILLINISPDPEDRYTHKMTLSRIKNIKSNNRETIKYSAITS